MSKLTPEEVRHGQDGYETSDTFSDGAMSDQGSCIFESETPKLAPPPARNARKKSIFPDNALSKTETDQDSRSDLTELTDHSPGNSVTSVNSVSSLLKEKLLMTFPKALKRRKKPKEYKLRGFVAMLFLAIVFLVGFAHVFYHQQVLQRAYFEKIRFNKEERVVRLFNNEGVEIALGYLGVDLPSGDTVYHCLPKDQKPDMVCLEWMHRARLYLSYNQKEGFRCYRFTWQSLHPDTILTDCFENGGQYGHWYGGGRTLGMAWPVELGQVEMSAFVTGHIGRHRWGSVLKRYFINSKGVALYIDPNTPLYVSINADEEASLCLQARQDNFAYVSHTGLPHLNYSVCTSGNMKELHSFLSEKSLWDGLKESDVEVVYSLLTEPVWQIAPSNKQLLTEAAIVNYTEDVIALGFLRQGHVLLNEHWQNQVGDFTFDSDRFPVTTNITIDIIHRRGFRIALTLQPFIATESRNFAAAVEEGLLVIERGNEDLRRVPALTQYKSVASAGMLDITNDQTIPWINRQLKELVEKYNVDCFYLDMGTAYDMPQYYQLHQNLTNPDHYKSLFTNKIQASHRVIGVSGAIARPPAPVFVSLPTLSSTWESLQVIIPTVLTYGIVGYPFLMPGPVGGDYLPKVVPTQTPVKSTINSTFEGLGIGDLRVTDKFHLPNKELYVRWLQLATFLPVIRYSHLPSEYDSDVEILEQAKVLTALRQQTVNPLMKKYAKEALDSGVPLIRPLWMLDPSDSACHLVVDEFSVGEELIVAPILRQGTHEREVYLPAGVWKDGIDSSLRKGSRWLHSYKVPGDKIAYFLKMPDNTRF
ncbi:myogenesis-regulating glycosidase isoform X2 [Rhodnius prolixus]|uniref:myogenesis-regulating glycosidase isoform X2 n=1 Tax=Rhodnius prolixus TaxID=13249 RepID=UPI003D188B9C